MTLQPKPDGADLSALRGEVSGVYAADEAGRFALVHPWHGGDYALRDVHDEFGIGTVETLQHGIIAVELKDREFRRLKAAADAYSFDYDEEFIEMCLALHRYARTAPQQRFVFYANFG